MKSFKDLVFEPHANGIKGATQARITFDNGWGVSLIHDGGEKQACTFYSGPDLYEVAPLIHNKLAATSITEHMTRGEGIWAFSSVERVNTIMRQLQSLVHVDEVFTRNMKVHDPDLYEEKELPILVMHASEKD